MTTSDSSQFLSNVGNLSYTYTFNYTRTGSNPLYTTMLAQVTAYMAAPRSYQIPSGIDSDIANALNSSDPTQRIEGFFAYVSKYGLTPSSGTDDHLTTFLKLFYGLAGGITVSSSSIKDTPVYSALKNVFLATTDLGQFLDNLTPPLSSQEQSNLEDTFFVNSFNDFTKVYPFTSYTGLGQNTVNYYKAYATYITQTASYDESSRQGNVLQDYESIYNAFVGQLQAIPASPGQPAMTPPSFSEMLSAFINSQTAGNGFFIPSQSLGDWVHLMQNSYSAYLTGAGAAYNTSVTTAQTARALVLYNVLRLLIQMIGSLQRIAAAQADRLNFLSAWQNAYTSLASQVHFFAYGDGSYIDGQTAKTNYFDDRYREKSNGNIWIWTWTRPDGTKMYASYPPSMANVVINPDNSAISDRIASIQQATETEIFTTIDDGNYSWFPAGSYTNVGSFNGQPVFQRNADNNLYYYTGQKTGTGDLIYTGIANGSPPSNFTDGGAYEKVMKPGSAPVSFTSNSGLAAQAAARDTGNQRGQNYVQTLQNFQSIISNAAKALQSNLNQSTDAANQQASFVDAILQKMSSIISAIFR